MKIFFPAICFFLTLGLLAQDFEGYALYNDLGDNTAYLIDGDGDIAHSWNCPTACNYSLALKPNGNIVRGAVNFGNQLNGAAVGGRLQELDPNANIVWEFIYSTSDYVTHHDIALMPNGNVLMTAWDVKTAAEMSALGFQGNGEKYPTRFIEVAQNGTGGEIVWQWNMYDHLVQDVDTSLPNYGEISENPQRLDINIDGAGGGGGPFGGGDWAHVNGLDYNAERDQIVFSSRFFSELFVIDHSTTTEEAAGSTGGNSGKGGDFLFRWGNPNNYGVAGEQVLPAAVHDARWIPNDDRPNRNGIMFFNNEGGPGNSSTVDIIRPPYQGLYGFAQPNVGEAYAPADLEFRHECLDNANGQSSAYRMRNGNTYVNLSGGYMYEVNPDGDLVWQYAAGPAKGFRYTCDFVGVQQLLNVDCNCAVNGTASFNSCGVCSGGDTGIDPENFDCNCDENGTAVMDNCGICVGGNTGVSPESVDCNCDQNGTAFLDDCSICVGGNSGITPESVDCNCEVYGTAAIDQCGDCTGGSTGLEACDTGVDDLYASISVYPNPSDGLFTIDGLEILSNFTVYVYNIEGKKIIEKHNDNELELSAFESGIYYLTIVQEDKTVLNKKISLLK